MKIARKKLVASFAMSFLALAAVTGCKPAASGGPDIPQYDEPAVNIHYQRTDNKYDKWNLWLWEGGKDGAQFDFNGKDDWGIVAAYPLSLWDDPLTNQLGFIVRKGEWEAKDVEADRYIDFSLYEKDEKDVYHVYLKTGDSNIYIDTEGNMRGKISMATFATMTNVAVRANIPITSYVLKCDGEVIVSKDRAGNVVYVNFKLPDGTKVDFTKEYVIELTLNNGDVVTSTISKRDLFSTEEFGDTYNYLGDDLGATYTSSQTTFKVWSPFSSSIILKIYNTGTPASLGGNDDPIQTVEMTKSEKGVFAASVTGDLEGKYYTYTVTNSSFQNKEIVDPYAKSCGVNGLRGMIVDFSKTNPEGWESVNYLPYDRKELVIYETHVADVTSSSSWHGTEANRKLFKGMYETGTTHTGANGVTVSTGFDHIKELGVNAVQLIPIFDQANDETNMSFNWGYNPLNYNCLEGGYSSDPYDGYARIREFKELVKAYNQAGISIIMDVVYNHVMAATASNFDVLLPGYYFRYTSGGDLSNGSGCGNETASDHFMMRKFIVESTKFWASEYKLGGFRFDLMGLHDLDTMEEVALANKIINPYSAIFGEPWTGGTSPLDESISAKQINGNKYVGYGAFNDQMRDALIKGGLNAATDLGWIADMEEKVQGSDSNKLLKGIAGTTAAATNIADPDKTVNYVTCHDNYTLYDRIIATKKYTAEDEELIAKMNVSANAVVFTSQGTSFMLAGEEFLRTKGGDHNSYKSSYKVNELDYELKTKHIDMFENYQQLINFKINCGGLHLNKEEAATLDVKMSRNGSTVSYFVTDANAHKLYFIAHANGIESDETFDLTGATLVWSTREGDARVISSETKLEQFETIICSWDISE